MSAEKAPWENFYSIVTQYKLNQKSSRQFIKPKKYLQNVSFQKNLSWYSYDKITKI